MDKIEPPLVKNSLGTVHPINQTKDFLLKMNMERKHLSNVMTSGEAAMYAINKNKFGILKIA